VYNPARMGNDIPDRTIGAPGDELRSVATKDRPLTAQARQF
jgi:hypothetical protein